MDFAVAFDSVNRWTIWRIIEKDGIPPNLRHLTETHYFSTRTHVGAAGQETTSFDKMSSTLFNYAVDFVIERALRRSQGVQTGEKQLP